MLRTVVITLLVASACKKDGPAQALAPTVVETAGVLHAVRCGDVTAEFLGDDPGDGAPKTFGANALRFRFGDNTVLPFMPDGVLEFTDWRFEVFSPTCETVALQQAHYGPLIIFKRADLRAVLERKLKPTVLEPKKTETAAVISDVLWKSGDALEFTASCCGGAEVYAASLTAAPKVIFSAPEAPHGVRRKGATFEVVP